ncbi:unnamed protein product [Brachionus calyciflorus]|uniref:Uncharacterized protein n=1 Tax=Brachionus calyciflorus TaxID=104777 RepID=A0A814A5K4_9BILA|nr:unnamed protein product [Brachionus calyciflorus]
MKRIVFVVIFLIVLEVLSVHVSSSTFNKINDWQSMMVDNSPKVARHIKTSIEGNPSIDKKFLAKYLQQLNRHRNGQPLSPLRIGRYADKL